MKIIHTSDWHLGAKLHERDRSADHGKFLDFLRAVIADERPDALLVAGDVFDVRQPSPSAQSLYYDFIADTARAGLCPSIVVTAGNHDSAQLLAAADQVLRRLGVRVVARASNDPSGETVALRDADGKCTLAVAAIPFMNDATLANFCTDASVEALPQKIAAGFRAHCKTVIDEARRLANGAPVVAMGHCTITGAHFSDSRSERARQIGGLDERDASVFAGADYVALGHLHIPQNVAGCERVRYCGSPLAMSFAEAAAAKSITVVEFGEHAGDAVSVREIPVPEFTPLKVLEGAQSQILAELAALADSAAAETLTALKVTEGEGDIAAFINSAREIVNAGRVEILVVEDARRRDASASQTLRETATLETLSPREVAMLRLADEHLSPDELSSYAAMLDDVISSL